MKARAAQVQLVATRRALSVVVTVVVPMIVIVVVARVMTDDAVE